MANFEKFRRILDLEEKIIRIKISNIDDTYITHYKKTDVHTMYIRLNAHNFEPIHELGHIFLAKKTKYSFFGGHDDVYIDSIYENLMTYVNDLLDCFVNYNISGFEGIYPIWIDFFNKIYSWARGKILDPPDYINEVLILYFSQSFNLTYGFNLLFPRICFNEFKNKNNKKIELKKL